MQAALLTTNIPDPQGWWLSEKYDGIRAIWTGEALLTRNGKRINAPEWWTCELPDRRLDGELWMGRGSFDKLASEIQKKRGDWKSIMFMVFDLAEDGTFEERYERLMAMDLLPDHVEVVEHRVCDGWFDLDETELEIVANGGEGCVIRRPGSPYRPGRVGDVVKVKRLVNDVDRWQG